eukprot:COSAG05_NODE_1747_length_4151_cov_4.600197_8_plen_49_part_00
MMGILKAFLHGGRYDLYAVLLSSIPLFRGLGQEVISNICRPRLYSGRP